jgi:hypothetical protein
MALPNRMSLCPGLLWLTLNLALIIQCLSWNNIFFFNFTYPLRCLRVPQVDYHWTRSLWIIHEVFRCLYACLAFNYIKHWTLPTTSSYVSSEVSKLYSSNILTFYKYFIKVVPRFLCWYLQTFLLCIP